MKAINLIFACTLLLMSCDPEKTFTQVENVNFGPFKPELVTNCSLSPDENPRVHVSITKPVVGKEAQDWSNIHVTDAEVMLFENGVSKGNFLKLSQPYDSTLHLLGFTPTPGNIYRLEASHPKYGKTVAIDTMPFPVPFTLQKTGKVRYQPFEGVVVNGIKLIDTFVEVVLTINDPPGSDFYRILISDSNWGLKGSNLQPSYQQANYASIASSDPLLSNSLEINFGSTAGQDYVYLPYAFFTDETFNGQKRSISFYIAAGDLKAQALDLGIPPDYVENFIKVKPKQYFALQRHSRASYLRNVSLINSELTSGALFTQPALLYSNTVGGYGILSSASTSIDSILLK